MHAAPRRSLPGLVRIALVVTSFGASAPALHAGNEDAPQVTWVEPDAIAPLPGRATAEQLHFLPVFVLSEGSCMPASAIDALGRLGKGLPAKRTMDGGCLPFGRANVYTQSLTVGDRTAHIYAVYFPKDGASPYGAGGHRHDWEHVIVWTRDLEVSAVTFAQHSGWYTMPRDRIRLQGEHPVVFVGRAKHGMYHGRNRGPGSFWDGICYFCDTRQDPGLPWFAPDLLVDVDSLPEHSRALLGLRLWDRANSPFRDDVFRANARTIDGGDSCRGLGCLCKAAKRGCPGFP
jgi:hypothetical protein